MVRHVCRRVACCRHVTHKPHDSMGILFMLCFVSSLWALSLYKTMSAGPSSLFPSLRRRTTYLSTLFAFNKSITRSNQRSFAVPCFLTTWHITRCFPKVFPYFAFQFILRQKLSSGWCLPFVKLDHSFEYFISLTTSRLECCEIAQDVVPVVLCLIKASLAISQDVSRSLTVQQILINLLQCHCCQRLFLL